MKSLKQWTQLWTVDRPQLGETNMSTTHRPCIEMHALHMQWMWNEWVNSAPVTSSLSKSAYWADSGLIGQHCSTHSHNRIIGKLISVSNWHVVHLFNLQVLGPSLGPKSGRIEIKLYKKSKKKLLTTFQIVFSRHHNEAWCPTLKLLHMYPFLLPKVWNVIEK